MSEGKSVAVAFLLPVALLGGLVVAGIFGAAGDGVFAWHHVAYFFAGVFVVAFFLMAADLWLARHLERSVASKFAAHLPGVERQIVEVRAETKAQGDATRLVITDTLSKIHSQLVDHLKAYQAVSTENHRIRSELTDLSRKVDELARAIGRD